MFLTILSFILLIAGGAGIFLGKKNNNVIFVFAGTGAAVLGLACLFASWSGVIGAILIGIGFCALQMTPQTAKVRIFGNFLILLAGIALIMAGQYGAFDGADSDLLKKEFRFNEVQGEYLGQFVRQQHSGKTVAIILPGNQNSRDGELLQTEKEFIAAFEKGFGGKVTVKAMPVPDMDMPGTDAPAEEIEKYMAVSRSLSLAASYDRTFDSVDCEVLVNLAGLPPDAYEFRRLSAFDQPGRIFILAENGNNQTERLHKIIKSGVIGGLVMISSTPKKLSEDLPDDLEGAFRARYVLITPDNVEEYVNDPLYKNRLTLPAEEDQAE